MESAIAGMESVVATVTGFHGTDRFNLIKLISSTGASYVGAMSKSISHLVCRRFEGRKYDLAKQFGNVWIVNHRWIEDCVKQRRRLPEHPYTLQLGQELGPLSFEIPTVYKFGFSDKNRKALSDKSNACHPSQRQVIDLGCEDPNFEGWTDSFLLNENQFPDDAKINSGACKSKGKQPKKTSKLGHLLDSGYCFQNPDKHEGSSSSPMHTGKEKRKISRHEGKRKISDYMKSVAETSHKGRRLVRQKIGSNCLETVLLDDDQDFQSIRLHNNGDATAASKCTGEKSNNNFFETERMSNSALDNEVRSGNEAFDDIEEIRDWHHLPAAKGSNSFPGNMPSALERSDGCSTIKNLNEKIKDPCLIETTSRSAILQESSCVICLTEFSSTRGILPCGHRFCYSCIQNWANLVALKRKIATCPLCKASFMSITKVEDAAISDQKIYSQTVPCASSTTYISLYTDQERREFDAEVQHSSITPVCAECGCREPEDLLVSCHLCQIRSVHSYCLDPPLLPWTCTHCKDLQMLYSHMR